MTRRQPRFLALTLLASASLIGLGNARAQGVTLSGVADLAARHVSNQGVGSVQSLVSGSNATSRLVLRGQERLGGDLWAGFHLEHGIALDTGNQATAALFWDRRSTLSLGSNAWGELRAGRDFVPTYRNWSRYDPFGYVGVASSSNLISATPTGPLRSSFGSNLNTAVRASNALQWLAPPSWGGVEVVLLAAAGEGGDAASGQARSRGAQLGYAKGPLSLGVAMLRTNNSLTGSGAFADAGVGASYDFGPVKLALAHRRFEQAQARQVHTLLGLWLPLGATELRASVQRVNASGAVASTRIDAGDATQLGLGAVYSLSPRSALYATAAQIRNASGARYAVPGGPAGLAAGKSSRGLELGLRHNF